MILIFFSLKSSTTANNLILYNALITEIHGVLAKTTIELVQIQRIGSNSKNLKILLWLMVYLDTFAHCAYWMLLKSTTGIYFALMWHYFWFSSCWVNQSFQSKVRFQIWFSNTAKNSWSKNPSCFNVYWKTVQVQSNLVKSVKKREKLFIISFISFFAE